jgi:hypothetical protein
MHRTNQRCPERSESNEVYFIGLEAEVGNHLVGVVYASIKAPSIGIALGIACWIQVLELYLCPRLDSS